MSGPEDINPGLSERLGGLKSELEDDDYIVDFVAPGPKVYSYRTFKGVLVTKIRGFSLNHENSQRLNYNTMKDIILKGGTVTTVNHKISRDLYKARLYNRREEKICKMVNNKLYRVSNNRTLPYGY